MFGLFRKKKKKLSSETRETPDTSQRNEAVLQTNTTIARWDTELAQIQRNFQAVLNDATTQSAPIVDALETNFAPLTRLWNTIRPQLHAHGERVSDLWDEISNHLADDDSVSDAAMEREGSKRDEYLTNLEILYTRQFREVMARGAHVMKQRVSDDDSRRLFEGGAAPRVIGEWHAQQPWEAMIRAEHAINRYRNTRDVPLDLLKAYQRASLEFNTTWLKVEAKHAPLMQPHIEKKLEGFMHHVNRKLRSHWQWREFEKDPSQTD